MRTAPRGDCSANCSARHMLSDTSAGPTQAKMPGDTNKTSSGCMHVPCPSPTVHLSCKSPWNAPTLIGPHPLHPPPVFAEDSSWVTVTNRDRPGHIDRVYGVTEVSTKGLLPQLTDVLHALTGSHSLLLGTIQSVRLEHISAVVSVVEKSRECSDGAPCGDVDAGWASSVERTTSRRLETAGPVPLDEVESSASSSRNDSGEFDTSPEPAVTATDVSDEVATLPSPASAEIGPSDRNSVAAVLRQDPSVLRQDPSQREEHEAPEVRGVAESENRNYNFFDELDTRLAGLRDAGSAGDC